MTLVAGVDSSTQSYEADAVPAVRHRYADARELTMARA
jgi:hypothetical protein